MSGFRKPEPNPKPQKYISNNPNANQTSSNHTGDLQVPVPDTQSVIFIHYSQSILEL